MARPAHTLEEMVIVAYRAEVAEQMETIEKLRTEIEMLRAEIKDTELWIEQQKYYCKQTAHVSGSQMKD